MDKRHLLLADQYDKLGLYKVADNLDFIKLSQNTSDPARGGLDDPYYPVQKPKPVAVPKKDTKKEKPKTISDPSQQDIAEKALTKIQPVLEKVEPAMGPLGVVFTISAIKELSKEALEIHAIQKLTNIAKNKSINPKQIQYLRTLISSSKISPEITALLQKSINNQIPTMEEVNALKPKMMNIGNSAKSFISKMKLIAAQNPAEAKMAEKVTEQLGKKVGIIKSISKTVPIAFVMLNALMLYPQAKLYFRKINAGDINEIWDDPEDRAKFVVFLADVISFFTSFFPPLAPLTAALVAISSGYQGGMYAFDKYKEFTGEKQKEELEKSFALNQSMYQRPSWLHDKYIFRQINKKGDIQSDLTPENLHKNITNLISEYVKTTITSAEAGYAIKVLVLPEILKILDQAMLANKETLNLKVDTIYNLPVLRNGKAISLKLKNGKYVVRNLAPVDFVKNINAPENRQAWFEFSNAIVYIVNDVNQAFDYIFGDKKKFRKVK